MNTYGQAIYCLKDNWGANNRYEFTICIVNAGTKLTFGLFINNLHTQLGFTNKSPLVDGYFGLTVNNNLQVTVLDQKNTFGPQHQIYSLGEDGATGASEYNKIDKMLNYLSNLDELIIPFDTQV
jgi:hypothetical protein